MHRSSRLLTALMASGALVAVPGSAAADGTPGGPSSSVAATAPDPVLFDQQDDPGDDPLDAPASGDPFCDAEPSPSEPAAAPDDVDAGELADDPADGAADDPGDGSLSADEASTDADPVDDPAPPDPRDLCDAPGAAAPARDHGAVPPTVLSLGAALGSGHLTAGAVTLRCAGTVTQQVTPAPGRTARALGPARSVRLASGHRRVTHAQTVRVPLHLTKAGRRALRKAGKEVRVTLRTTVRLCSGKRSTRTQVLVLRRGALRPAGPSRVAPRV